MRKITNRAGFSLIELLVCVAILGLLFSIFSPTIVKAQKQSQRVKCAANLKQIYLSYFIYTIEDEYDFDIDLRLMKCPSDKNTNIVSYQMTTRDERFLGIYWITKDVKDFHNRYNVIGPFGGVKFIKQ